MSGSTLVFSIQINYNQINVLDVRLKHKQYLFIVVAFEFFSNSKIMNNLNNFVGQLLKSCIPFLSYDDCKLENKFYNLNVLCTLWKEDTEEGIYYYYFIILLFSKLQTNIKKKKIIISRNQIFLHCILLKIVFRDVIHVISCE